LKALNINVEPTFDYNTGYGCTSWKVTSQCSSTYTCAFYFDQISTMYLNIPYNPNLCSVNCFCRTLRSHQSLLSDVNKLVNLPLQIGFTNTNCIFCTLMKM